MNAIVPGSLGAIAQQNNKSLAETFLSADVIVLVDVSGSMMSHDSRGGKSRYDVACEELANLQNSMPGKIAVINFSNSAAFSPSGIPTLEGGGTNLTAGLKYIKVADIPGAMKFILISDGMPDDREGALNVARTFQNHIDVIYVGPEEMPIGRDFLYQLAKATGGQSVTADKAKELSATVQRLLLADKISG